VIAVLDGQRDSSGCVFSQGLELFAHVDIGESLRFIVEAASTMFNVAHHVEVPISASVTGSPAPRSSLRTA
jgi:hypothetical protein